MDEYAIGLSGSELISLRSVGIPAPFPVEFQPYTKVIGGTVSGNAVEVGPPTLDWNFKLLTPQGWNFFYNTICGNLASREVYVRTATRDAAGFPFATFRAIMWRPTCEQVVPGCLYSRVKIVFKRLVRM